MQRIVKREIRTIQIGMTFLSYELQRKKIKNINLHVRNGRMWVSAPLKTDLSVIENFIQQKGETILRAIRQFPENTETLTPQEERERRKRCETLVLPMCRDFYEQIQAWKIPFPEIRFRKMSSRWGSCNPAKKVLTFSTMLADMPIPFVEYVVAHEFVHFKQANHSKEFYAELARYMPDYKVRKAQGVKCSVDKP